ADFAAANVPALSGGWLAAFPPADVVAIAAADVGVAVKVVIHVDVDIPMTPAATPSPATSPSPAHRDSYSKRDRSGRIRRSVVRRIINIRIWIHRWSPDINRVIRRYIDDFWI